MSLGLKDVSREKFIESNLGLVHSCANRFRGKGIEYEEMYAAGCIGLVKAYDAFDHGRGVKEIFDQEKLDSCIPVWGEKFLWDGEKLKSI